MACTDLAAGDSSYLFLQEEQVDLAIFEQVSAVSKNHIYNTIKRIRLKYYRTGISFLFHYHNFILEKLTFKRLACANSPLGNDVHILSCASYIDDMINAPEPCKLGIRVCVTRHCT